MAQVQPTRFQTISDRIVRSWSQRSAGDGYESMDSEIEARLTQLETSQALIVSPEKRPIRSKSAMRTSSLQEAWENAFRRGLTNASAHLLAASYGASITGYACAQHNANTMSSVNLKIHKPDGQPYEETPPAMAWLMNNRRDLLWHISVSLDLWGKAYLRKIRNPFINPQTGLGFPSQLEWLNPVHVWEEIDPSTEEVLSYRVGINQEFALPRDIVVIPGFDPRNANGAISRFEVALRNITVERNMVNYSAGFFLRNAQPDGIVNVPDDGASDEVMKQVRDDWDALFSGSNNSHRTAFFFNEDGVTYTPIERALKDLAMPELDAQTVSKIAAALRVNPVLIGMAYVADALSAQNTYDGISRDHYNTVTLPDLEIVLEHLNRQWAWTEFDPPKIFTIVSDASDIAVLTPLTDERGALAASMHEAGLMKLSEGREYIGLDPAEEGVIEFERNPTNALAALQGGGMSLAQYQEFMGWPTFGTNSQVIQIAGQWFPVEQLHQVAESNAEALAAQGGLFGGFPMFPASPAEPSAPDLLPAGKQESLPANIEASQSLNGAQISSALAVISGVTDGTVSPNAAIELLNALGIQRERAKLMVESQSGIVIDMPSSPAPLIATTNRQDDPITPPVMSFGFDVGLAENQVVNEISLQAQENAPTTVEWITPDRWHLSLVYADDPQAFPVIQQFLIESARDEFEVKLTGLEIFDDTPNRALVLMVEPSSNLIRLQEDIARRFELMGVPIGEFTRPGTWRPHISIADNWQGGLPNISQITEPIFLDNIRLVIDGDGFFTWGFDKLPAPPNLDTVTFEQRRELTNWQRKVEKRGADVAFEPEHISAELHSYVRKALDAMADPRLAFDCAREWLKTGVYDLGEMFTRQAEDEPDEDTPGEEPQDPNAMSAEAVEFWKHYDKLQHDIGADWLEWMGGVGEAVISQIVADPGAALESLESLNADALVDTWVGTEETPGPLLALTLAGMAAGNDALERKVTTNPENAPQRAGPEQTLIVGWDVLSQEALAFVRDFTENLITGINETTFNRIQEIIRAWIESGEPLTALRTSLNEIFSDPKRAGVIAQTESTRVYAAGAVTRFENAGITKVNWHTVRDNNVDAECRQYAKNSPVSIKDGWAKRDSKGEIVPGAKTVKMPPAHVGCRCWVSPFLGSIQPPGQVDPADIAVTGETF